MMRLPSGITGRQWIEGFLNLRLSYPLEIWNKVMQGTAKRRSLLRWGGSIQDDYF